MDGAIERDRRARAMAWQSAALIRTEKMPDFWEWTGVAKPPPAAPDWQAELARWEAYAARRH